MKAVVQKHDMGCGIACVAFLLGSEYKKVVRFSEISETKLKRGFSCKDLIKILERSGKRANYFYTSRRRKGCIYNDGTIVFIKKSERYPLGHYLCRYKNQWMDPWINNLLTSKDVKSARAGFRKRLPGRPIYAILPHFFGNIY